MSSIQVNFVYCSSTSFLFNKYQIQSLYAIFKDILMNFQLVLDCLSMLNASQRIEMNALCIIYKLKNHMLPNPTKSRNLKSMYHIIQGFTDKVANYGMIHHEKNCISVRILTRTPNELLKKFLQEKICYQ